MTPAEAKARLEEARTDADRPYALHLQLLQPSTTPSKGSSHE